MDEIKQALIFLAQALDSEHISMFPFDKNSNYNEFQVKRILGEKDAV